MKINYLSLLLFLLTHTAPFGLRAQNLSNHQWKDRVLIIKTTDRNDSTYKHQIGELENYNTELEERKLFIYQINDDQYKEGLSPDSTWNKIKTINDKFIVLKSKFEIILIGLDGSVKLRQNKYLAPHQLFGKIDSMPMRRQELKNKQ
ncbi:DUF4174 domain-containing protein [Echinicola shivajiensis]|uniref:DUF4174 domain-containing protein n=1 Tax=Echinicola shivajiensis TaxID=1035916 RepID=UPI001BFCA06D|nr:DUF4174 domain-containing protein [Echinicola shivajiensis]